MPTRISGLSTLCKRIAAILRRCDVKIFLSTGHLYANCAPREKRLDVHINSLRRGEFRDVECVKDIEVRGQKKFNFWSWLFFSIGHRSSSTSSQELTSSTNLAERESGSVLTLDHDLDIFAASINLSKTSVAAIIKEEGVSSFNANLLEFKFNLYFSDVVIDMGGYNIDEVLFDPLGVFLTKCKSAKTLSRWVLWTLFEEVWAFLPLLSRKWSRGCKTSHRILRRWSHMSSHKWRHWIISWPNWSTLVFQCVIVVIVVLAFLDLFPDIFFILGYSLHKK